MRGLHAARAALLLLAAWALACGRAAAGEVPVSNLDELEETKVPSGFVSLCAREPELCAPVLAAPRQLNLSALQWAVITSVNTAINRSIVSTTDEKLYGRLEYWTLPHEAGDCEDYVLLKRKTLSGLGIPLASLLITVVHDENGEGHAVLSIPTTRGDLVLDNRRDEVLHWQATGYKFVKRQSAADPNVWVSLARGKLQALDIASAPAAPPAD